MPSCVYPLRVYVSSVVRPCVNSTLRTLHHEYVSPSIFLFLHVFPPCISICLLRAYNPSMCMSLRLFIPSYVFPLCVCAPPLYVPPYIRSFVLISSLHVPLRVYVSSVCKSHPVWSIDRQDQPEDFVGLATEI